MGSLGQHRVRLDNLLLTFWNELCEDIEPQLRQNSQISDKLTTAARNIDAEAATIQALETELSRARQEIARLTGAHTEPKLQAEQAALSEKALAVIDGISHDSKENLPAAAAPRNLRTLAKAVSPPPKIEKVPAFSAQNKDVGWRDVGMETDCFDTSDTAYYHLARKYDALRRETLDCKDAYEKLKAKYNNHKQNWKEWTMLDISRRGKKYNHRPTGSPDTTRSVSRLNSPITRVATPQEKGVSPLSRATTPLPRELYLRPNSTAADSLQYQTVTDRPGSATVYPSSISVTPTQRPRAKGFRVSASDVPPEQDEDTECSGVDVKVVAASEEPMLPPQCLTPKTTENERRLKSGNRPVSPVVIKSEPRSGSSEGTGWHDFHQSSLDLDEIGDRQREMPRKKRKILNSLSKERPFSGTGTSVGDRVLDDQSTAQVRTLSTVKLAVQQPVGMRTESQLIQELSPQYMVSDVGRLAHKPQTPSRGSLSPRATDVRPPLKPSGTSEGQHSACVSVQKRPAIKAHTAAQRRNRHNSRGKEHREAAIGALEDGTDGLVYVNAVEGRDVRTKVGLEHIISTPERKPSLNFLLRTNETTSRSLPTKRHPGAEDFSTPDQRLRLNSALTDPLPKTKSVGRGLPADNLDLADFTVNPRINQGVDYAFHETVRDKQARKCLPACTKPCCSGLPEFAEAAGMPKVVKELRWRSSSPRASDEPPPDVTRQLVDRFGKHRDAFARRTSPPGFWNPDMPDSPEQTRINERAEQVRQSKIGERKREAAKGAKGRYMYRDQV